MIWTILIIAILCFILYKVWRELYFINIDSTILFTGAPGTGKTNEMVTLALKLRRKINNQIKFKNWYQRFKMPGSRKYQDLIEIYANFPIRVGKLKNRDYKAIQNNQRWIAYAKKHDLKLGDLSRSKLCYQLEIGHLLNQIKLPKRAITVVSELGSIASQYDWGNLNVQEHMEDFIRLYRQYTQGGYFLGDDQSSDNIAVNIRRRIGTIHNMLHFRKWWKVYWVSMRNITISEDIKMIETDQATTHMKTRIGIFPLFHLNYDTYTFSDRYNTVPLKEPIRYFGYKTNEVLELPVTKIIKYQGEEYKQGVLPSHLNLKDSQGLWGVKRWRVGRQARPYLFLTT